MQTGEFDSASEQAPKLAKPAKFASKAHGQNKVFLKVPFSEKDRAKALGARWDAAQKKWYVPPGVDVSLFGAWLPDARKE